VLPFRIGVSMSEDDWKRVKGEVGYEPHIHIHFFLPAAVAGEKVALPYMVNRLFFFFFFFFLSILCLFVRRKVAAKSESSWEASEPSHAQNLPVFEKRHG